MLASRNTWSTEKIFRILSKILSFSVILIPFKNFCSWTPCSYNYLLWYWVFHPIWWEFFSNLWQESYLSTEDLHFQKLPENQQKPIFHYSPDSNTGIWYLTQYWFSVSVSVYGSPSGQCQRAKITILTALIIHKMENVESMQFICVDVWILRLW